MQNFSCIAYIVEYEQLNTMLTIQNLTNHLQTLYKVIQTKNVWVLPTKEVDNHLMLLFKNISIEEQERRIWGVALYPEHEVAKFEIQKDCQASNEHSRIEKVLTTKQQRLCYA